MGDEAACGSEKMTATQQLPEFVKPMAQYIAQAVSDRRLEDGRKKLAEHGRLLETIERTYGVDRHIIVAIWGMESSYGQVLDNPKLIKGVIRSLATLAYADKRRSNFAKKQLLASLKILQRGDVSFEGFTGSWAGAMGHTQFIPTTFEAYAVDFDGDGRRDLWNSRADVVGSVSNYFVRHGWRAGEPVAFPVELSERLPAYIPVAEKKPKKPGIGLSQLDAAGIERPEGLGDTGKVSLIRLESPEDEYWLGTENFYVITRYNHSELYAMAVYQLAKLISHQFKKSA